MALSDQILAECRVGRSTGPICAAAAGAKAEPIPLPGLSSAELTEAVADYLRANPPAAGRVPSNAEVTSAVANYLRANPPRPGRAPTPGEIAAAVAVYYAANPPAPGRDGDDGEPGRAPTVDEISAAVTTYLRANPPPPGRDGVDGVDGEDGADGADGRDGNPAQTQTFTTADGRTFTCTRNEGSPDTAPTYACTQQQPAGTGP